MSSPDPILVPRPRYSRDDLAFVEECLDRYFAHLTDDLRVGVALGSHPRPAGYNWKAYLIPPEMWDGSPDVEGYVRWKRLHLAPSSPDPEWAAGGSISPPPLLRAYLDTQRIGRMLLRVGGRSILLPATPAHEPRWDLDRLVDQWLHVALQTGYLVFARSEDESVLYCTDRRIKAADEDRPVLEISRDSLHRLLPALASDSARQTLESRLRPAFASFRELLALGCLQPSSAWTGPEASPYRRNDIGTHLPFDWTPYLTPEPLLDVGCDEFDADAVDEEVVAACLSRLTDKFALLRRADPAYLDAGAEYTHHLPNPTLLAEDLRAFERREGVRLPAACARFLTGFGNGGVGVWRGQPRLEILPRDHRGPIIGGRLPEGHFARPFPYRTRWNPFMGGTVDPDELADYQSPRHVEGTVAIGYKPRMEDGTISTIRLVVSGPERGHIWSDDRSGRRGICPTFRAGPYTFLAWHEEGVDGGLSAVDQWYRSEREGVR